MGHAIGCTNLSRNVAMSFFLFLPPFLLRVKMFQTFLFLPIMIARSEPSVCGSPTSATKDLHSQKVVYPVKYLCLISQQIPTMNIFTISKTVAAHLMHMSLAKKESLRICINFQAYYSFCGRHNFRLLMIAKVEGREKRRKQFLSPPPPHKINFLLLRRVACRRNGGRPTAGWKEVGKADRGGGSPRGSWN